MRMGLLSALTVCWAAGVAGAAEPEDKGKVDPPGTPLEARLIVKKAEYVLDRKGQTAEEYQKAATTRPLLVDVDLVLELRNTSDKPITIWIAGDYRQEVSQKGGDYVTLTLDLQGPGAVSATVTQRYTRPATPPPTLGKIDPGKSFVLPITSLAYGTHGVATFVAQRACWTAPGEYTLTATFKTAVSPAPPGSKEAKWAHFDGGLVTVTSAPVKLKVVEADKKP
jgi:hypothetical protein